MIGIAYPLPARHRTLFDRAFFKVKMICDIPLRSCANATVTGGGKKEQNKQKDELGGGGAPRSTASKEKNEKN